ncbi:MAG: hypothetical protein Q4C22_05835 [Bacillota bacterium]|nr:hypothetical protein [Bacillota bacterium]
MLLKKRSNIEGKKEEREMKQMIVLVSMVILGIFIGGLVLGFQDSAQEIATSADTRLDALFSEN